LKHLELRVFAGASIDSQTFQREREEELPLENPRRLVMLYPASTFH